MHNSNLNKEQNLHLDCNNQTKVSKHHIEDFTKARLIALDFETAGYAKDSACAIGMVKIENSSITDSFYSLIKPPNSRIYFTEVHGLTWNDLKNAPTFLELWNDIYTFTKDAQGFIAHNAPFDRGIYYGTSQKYEIPIEPLPFFCTLKAARKQFCLPKNRLSHVCAFLNIDLDHHNALSDAYAAAKIFLHCLQIGYNWNLSKLK